MRRQPDAASRAKKRNNREGRPRCALDCIGRGNRCRRQGAATSDFTRDVRPILSEHCFKCHGPDDVARQAKLRLDLREAALAKTGAGTVPIVPGKPDASEVVRRILSHDADEMMPPPTANKPLSDEKKRILRDLDCRRGTV